MSTWFDAQSGMFRLDEIVAERKTFKRIMEDGVVTEEEVAAQSQIVLDLLRRTEAHLDAESRALVEELLAELAVLYAASQYHNLQQATGHREA